MLNSPMALLITTFYAYDRKLYCTIRLELFENRRRNIISLNQPRAMSANMAANGIRIHARTIQRFLEILTKAYKKILLKLYLVKFIPQ